MEMIDTTMVVLGGFAFCAGLIDASVGGGGLVQIPALLNALPHQNIATILGTNKLAVWAGTASAIGKYIPNIVFKWELLLPTLLSAFVSAFLGAYVIDQVPQTILRYGVFALLIVMAIYTFMNKTLGAEQTKVSWGLKQIVLGILFGGLIGFYDGIFGAGSGSLLLFMFVKVFGFNFVQASAYTKVVNLATFTSALLFFIPSGHVLWHISGLVALCNVSGSIVGVYLALRYGNGSIRWFFLILLMLLITRMALTLF